MISYKNQTMHLSSSRTAKPIFPVLTNGEIRNELITRKIEETAKRESGISRPKKICSLPNPKQSRKKFEKLSRERLRKEKEEK